MNLNEMYEAFKLRNPDARFFKVLWAAAKVMCPSWAKRHSFSLCVPAPPKYQTDGIWITRWCRCPGNIHFAQETNILELYEGKINIDDMAVVLRFNGQNYSFTVHDTAVFPFVQIASYCPPICSVSKRSHSHSLDHGLETEWYIFAMSPSKSLYDWIGWTVRRLVVRNNLKAALHNQILTTGAMINWASVNIYGIQFFW